MSSFLLVSLNVDAILGEITLHQRRKKLDETTKGEGLGDAYTATLSRMKAQPGGRSKLGMEVLMWVSHAERPLDVDELCHALGVEKGSDDLNIGNIPAIETLLACSLGLVTVEKSSSTIRLVHYTLQEYLSHNPDLFLNPHSFIAEVCLTYLNFRHIRDFSLTLDSVPSTTSFVEYASCYWGTHAQRETTASVKTLALELLDGYEKHISSKILSLHAATPWERNFYGKTISRGFAGLHCAAYFGCVEITVALLKTNKWAMQASDFNGNMALVLAANQGHEGVVRVLLEQRDIYANIPDTKYGQTPLLLAAENGHEGVVRMLLGRSDVNPDRADVENDRTPLSCAAENGYEGVVRMLLERNDVNPDKADDWVRTPIWWAAKNRHEGVVRMLLERNDINPNTTDAEHGRTPLSWAAENGHEGFVRMFLERSDVNSNTPDPEGGRTPLLWAAQKGHEGVVRILLQRADINPNIADKECGQTPLSPAAENGHEGVVRMLLERNDVNPDTADTKHGRTPLSRAAENGHAGIVRMLLERNDVNPGKADNWSQTPLLLGAGGGHEGVVRMLLERNDVTLDKASAWGLTPLALAAQNGHEGVLRMLLSRGDVNLDKADQWSLTPLSLAARNGHERIVKLLREATDLAPKCAVSLQSTELFSLRPSGLSKPPSKRARKF